MTPLTLCLIGVPLVLGITRWAWRLATCQHRPRPLRILLCLYAVSNGIVWATHHPADWQWWVGLAGFIAAAIALEHTWRTS